MKTQFEVLVICTANHCRSPLVEHLLQERMTAAGLPWQVSSAGTHAHDGDPMHRYADRILRRRGIDTGDWTSRSVDRSMIDHADLVVTATEAHRAEIARLSISARPHTFTLREFAHLSSSLPRGDGSAPRPALGPELLAHAASARGRVQPLPPSERDLVDPFGYLYWRFRRCAKVIDQSVDQIVLGHASG